MDKELTKFYLSGKIDGLSYQQADDMFYDAEESVRGLFGDNIIIVNPWKLPHIHNSWADYIIEDLIFLKDCDAIVMLDNWKESSGAQIEKMFAEKLGIKVMFLNEQTD